MSTGQQALVLVSYGSHGVVQLQDGSRLDCKYRRSVGRPYCGDRVMVGIADQDSGVVESILPRRNQFDRADQQLRRLTVAANLDRVLIVIATRPLPSRDLLDRYLLAVHSLGIEPLIVLNKVDLETEDRVGDHLTLQRLPEYRQLGYTVRRTSCKGPPGIEALIADISHGTHILVGQTGVGKSSLVRQLLPDLEIQVGELSRVTGKGTHTTTSTTLYTLPQGGQLIDSPGVWEYGLWRLEDSEVAEGFREFAPYFANCRFNDCLHVSEPGCAVKQAVENGQIAEWRFRAYLRLQEQNRRSD